MTAPTIDTSRLPLLIVRFDGEVSDAEFDGYLAEMTSLLDWSQKTVTILDARRAVRNPATQRKKQAEWIEKHSEQLRRYSLGTAFIIHSPLVRGVLTAILWVRPLPTEHTVVSTMEEAEAWARERLAAVGLGPTTSRRP